MAAILLIIAFRVGLSFNTQPPEGGCDFTIFSLSRCNVSTHSHPKVAANTNTKIKYSILMFQHTATRRWLQSNALTPDYIGEFQHTATRRWLQCAIILSKEQASFNTQPPEGGCNGKHKTNEVKNGFNTQPPEGGCQGSLSMAKVRIVSTHSHPKVAAWSRYSKRRSNICFNTQPPEGGC